MFLRILTTLEATGTFKPRKQELMQAGFDPRGAAGPLYFDDPRSQRYEPVDLQLFASISAGTLRF